MITRPQVAIALVALASSAVVSGCAASTHRPHSIGPAPSRTSGRKPGANADELTVPGTVTGCPASKARRVSSAAQLSSAIATAAPGETISLAPGVYTGEFVAQTSGRPSAPITLCGSRAAVLAGVSISHGYVVYLKNASWWRLDGFTVQGGQKGVVADHADHDLIYGLYVHGTGDEAIHLRSFSSDNTISHCVIRNTGLLVQFFGEGIYVGSAHKNWCRYTNCQPDRSNDNKIIDNNIADTTAENIDIKEGTTGGQITRNHFDGVGMVASAATAWINVKGNDWVVSDNTGIDSIGDGFAVHQVYPGWGIGNTFAGNRAQLNGPGYGYYVQSRSLKTVLACSNVASGAGAGRSNVPCSGGRA